MKKLVVLSTMAVVATSAHALDYKFNLESRMDYLSSTTTVTPVAGSGLTEYKDKWANFSNSTVRIGMMGSVNDSLTYRLRYRFVVAAPTVSSATTTGAGGGAVGNRELNTAATAPLNGLDWMYVDHKNSMFTTRIGKVNWNRTAGNESVFSGTDVFLTSLALANYRLTTATTGAVQGGTGSEYRYGVGALYTLPNSLGNLDIAITNPNNAPSDTLAPAGAAATNTERSNSSLSYGAYYVGSFMNKMIQPILSYTANPQDGDTDGAATTKTKKVNYSMMAYGIKSEVAGFTINLDMKEFKRPDRNDGTTVAPTIKGDKSKSTFAHVAYSMGEWTPMAMYIDDKYTNENTTIAATGNQGDFKRKSWAVGTYYKPFADVGFRYHAMYSSVKNEWSSTSANNSKTVANVLTLGIKADI